MSDPTNNTGWFVASSVPPVTVTVYCAADVIGGEMRNPRYYRTPEERAAGEATRDTPDTLAARTAIDRTEER